MANTTVLELSNVTNINVNTLINEWSKAVKTRLDASSKTIEEFKERKNNTLLSTLFNEDLEYANIRSSLMTELDILVALRNHEYICKHENFYKLNKQGKRIDAQLARIYKYYKQ